MDNFNHDTNNQPEAPSTRITMKSHTASVVTSATPTVGGVVSAPFPETIIPVIPTASIQCAIVIVAAAVLSSENLSFQRT